MHDALGRILLIKHVDSYTHKHVLWFKGSPEDLLPEQQIGTLLKSSPENTQLELHLCKTVTAVQSYGRCLAFEDTENISLYYRTSVQVWHRQIIQRVTALRKTSTKAWRWARQLKARESRSLSSRWTRCKMSSFRSASWESLTTQLSPWSVKLELELNSSGENNLSS